MTYGAGFPKTAIIEGEVFSWHAARFRMPDEGDNATNWVMDLILAHKVAGPVLLEYTDQLPLWRFHRRSASDDAGHQFSLIFYASTATAEAVFRQIGDNPLLDSARSEGYLDRLHLNYKASENYASIAGTSDPSWSQALQRQWPSFIMGASATWLGLIEESLAEPEHEHETLAQLILRYQGANEAIAKIWQLEGQHAFFHHISAIFGYQAVEIHKLIRF